MTVSGFTADRFVSQHLKSHQYHISLLPILADSHMVYEAAAVKHWRQ